MAKIPQIRGMLLEETLLYLITVCGYTAVDYNRNDSTHYLRPKDKALCIRGRGENHQIDAIADFFLTPPFSHTQRLLIEAKYYKDRIGLPVLRNVVGTLKDVSEFWTAANRNIGRYHYQYAVISGSGFTDEAERYAFAHDIYLLPVHKSKYFRRLLQAIKDVTPGSFDVRDENSNIPIELKGLRLAIRQRIAHPEDEKLSRTRISREARNALNNVCQECRRIRVGLLATINGDFPLFLVPNPTRLTDLVTSARGGGMDARDVHIRRDEGGGWILQHRGEDFFSFDVPSAMFRQYTEQARSQTGEVIEVGGLLMNLGKRLDDDIENEMVRVNFQLSRTELDQLIRRED